MNEGQVDEKTAAVIQAAEDKCRNEGLEDGRRYVATDALQLTQWQSSEMLLSACGYSSSYGCRAGRTASNGNVCRLLSPFLALEFTSLYKRLVKWCKMCAYVCLCQQ